MASSLANELGIPHSATLPTKSQTRQSPSLRVISSGSSIPITAQTSVHNSTKFLLIGRQADTSDIRIDHKSISRKHAALYFCPSDKNDHNESTSRSNCAIDLVLKDLGGKHGCTVNGNKLERNTTARLKNLDTIIFGNVREQVFQVENVQGIQMIEHVDNGIKEESTNEIDQKTAVSSSSSSSEKPKLYGRAAREAEIAAMMESLDHEPTYNKYKPDPNEELKSMLSIGKSKDEVDMNDSIKKDKIDIPNSLIKRHKIPMSKSIKIANVENSSIVTSISLDPSGSRLLVGMSNATIRLYDFNGMDLSLQPFKVISIQEGRYSIVSTTFSNSGDRIMVGSTSAQPVVLNRDGFEIIEFTKGDMYVTDMVHTDGHVANITGVDWHPLDRDIVITSSLDGSVRQWDLKGKTKFEKLCCGKNVYRIKSSAGKKTKVTCVKYSPTGREFACGTDCGSIQIWNSTKVGSRPDRVIYSAHDNDVAIHSLVFSSDAKKLASRCMDDDCVKIWETRKLSRSSKPIAFCDGLPNRFEYANVAFGPNGNLLCAGTSVEPPTKQQLEQSIGEFGQLKLYDIENGSKLLFSASIARNISVITCTWHKKLNQIILGLSDGSVRIFYDPVMSSKGALLPVSKGLKQEDGLYTLLKLRAPTGSAGINLSDIQTPHALPMYRDKERNTKRKREKERQDPIKSKRPDLPGTGIKAGESTSAGLNFQQYNLTSAIHKNKNIAGKDPREELFKYQEGKTYTKVSYEGDIKVLAEKTAEQEEEDGL